MQPRRLRVLLLAHVSLVPPESSRPAELKSALWKTEYEVVQALRALGHEVAIAGLHDDASVIGNAVTEHRPHIAFNMMEEFDGVGFFDQNVVSYLELMRLRYTGCNPRGMMLARDKALTKKILSYHGIPTPEFFVVARGAAVKRPSHVPFPFIVKSTNEEASLGISQASIVHDDATLADRVRFMHEKVGSDALVERYIDGRELYVGTLGNVRVETLPVWELRFDPAGDSAPIATRKAKWDPAYRKRHGIRSTEARDLTPSLAAQAQDLARRVHRTLGLNGYARMDFRLSPEGELFFLEANPNPHIGPDEDFARSAKQAGLGYEDLLWKILNLGLRWRPAA